MTGPAPYEAAAEHLTLAVRLTPKAASDRIDGCQSLADGSFVLAVHVRAAPEDGKANTALTKLLAKALGVPASAVSIRAGHKSRLKQVRVEGDPGALLDTARRLWPSSAKNEGSNKP